MVAPDFTTAIKWQNRTDFGLTAGLQSLDEAECELWMDRIQAGNLYVNRGTTGAIVNRQPFGGWRRSSVGPTAKAGGHHYVNSLRRWAPLTDATSSDRARRVVVAFHRRSGDRPHGSDGREELPALPPLPEGDLRARRRRLRRGPAITHRRGRDASRACTSPTARRNPSPPRPTRSSRRRRSSSCASSQSSRVRWLSSESVTDRRALGARGERRSPRARPTRRRRDGPVAARAERVDHAPSLRQRERRTETELRGSRRLSARGLGPRCDGVGPWRRSSDVRSSVMASSSALMLAVAKLIRWSATP